jgi:hypothetical protein
MEALEQRRYSKGTVALVFAQAEARRTNQGFATKAMASLASIFEGSENPDPGAVAAALETEASNSQAYLVLMNDNVGFTLLHHLQRLKCEIRPGDPIINRVVAFEGDIWPQGPTPNVVVFDEVKDIMFRRLFLPPVRLPETLHQYSVRVNGNNQNNTFVVDPAVTERVTGPVTQVIPIPMEWTPMFVDGPNFGTAIRRVFDLFDSLDENDRVDLYPIAEMMGMACCAADNGVGAVSTLSTRWTRLMYHARTKKWASGVWERHSEWDDQEHQAPGGTPPQAAPSPIAQFQILFGK